LIVLVVGISTYAMRALAIVAVADREIPPSVARLLRYVGPAVLAALAINLAAGGGPDAPSLEFAEAAALGAAGVVAWFRKSVIWSLVAGMVTLWVLDAIL
jgi:branched-subunit amino acid transport protein